MSSLRDSKQRKSTKKILQHESRRDDIIIEDISVFYTKPRRGDIIIEDIIVEHIIVKYIIVEHRSTKHINFTKIPSGLIKVSSMVPSWLLHGLSIENPQIDGGTMDEPWTNHGGTPYECPIYLRSFFSDIRGIFSEGDLEYKWNNKREEPSKR